MICNFCQSDCEHVYTPIGSLINLKIHVCNMCGLVQSSYNDVEIEPEDQINRLSCDADYSFVRVGKQQMLKNFLPLSRWTKGCRSVLDFRAARFDFVNWACNAGWFSFVDAIEEDVYMVPDTIPKNSRLHTGKYYELDKKWDFIYACHTLEHYQDPVKVLTWMRNHLNTNGLLYIEVPNLNWCTTKWQIDEYFYDKHLFYFDKYTLINKIHNIGFTLIENVSNHSSLCLLFQKTANMMPVIPCDDNKRKLETYRDTITRNREHISSLSLAFENGCVLGCGRVFDYLVKSGFISVDSFTYLVDDYLNKATDSLYGRNLSKMPDECDLYLSTIKSPKNTQVSPQANHKIFLEDIICPT